MSSTATRRTAVAAVLVVALVAAIVSYAHMQHLAERHGEEWRSVLIPLAVDGMLVAATLAIVSQRRYGLRAGWVPWLGLTLGILASLAANVAAARPELIAQLIAAWPPVALAVSIETLVVVLRVAPKTAPIGAVSNEVKIKANPPIGGVLDGDQVGETPIGVTPDPVVEQVRAFLAENPDAGRPTIARELSITEHRARKALEAMNGRIQ